MHQQSLGTARFLLGMFFPLPTNGGPPWEARAMKGVVGAPWRRRPEARAELEHQPQCLRTSIADSSSGLTASARCRRASLELETNVLGVGQSSLRHIGSAVSGLESAGELRSVQADTRCRLARCLECQSRIGRKHLANLVSAASDGPSADDVWGRGRADWVIGRFLEDALPSLLRICPLTGHYG